MITLGNITIHEMIGLRTMISASTNGQIVGLTGNIVDETKSMFTINTKNGFKMIPKKQNTWKFFLDQNESTFSGTLLERRSFDRLGAKL
jgi:ribonuclease P protein subunit POP4